MSEDELTGEDRCWPCAVANLVAGALVAGAPLALVWGSASGLQLGLAGAWALAASVFTIYRVVDRGYLPGAGAVARATGLHDRIGPGADTGSEGREGGSEG